MASPIDIQPDSEPFFDAVDVPQNPSLMEINRVGRYRTLKTNPQEVSCSNTKGAISHEDFYELKDGSVIVQRMDEAPSTNGFECYKQSQLQEWLEDNNTDPMNRQELTPQERNLIFNTSSPAVRSTHTLVDHTATTRIPLWNRNPSPIFKVYFKWESVPGASFLNAGKVRFLFSHHRQFRPITLRINDENPINVQPYTQSHSVAYWEPRHSELYERDLSFSFTFDQTLLPPNIRHFFISNLNVTLPHTLLDMPTHEYAGEGLEIYPQ